MPTVLSMRFIRAYLLGFYLCFGNISLFLLIEFNSTQSKIIVKEATGINPFGFFILCSNYLKKYQKTSSKSCFETFDGLMSKSQNIYTNTFYNKYVINLKIEETLLTPMQNIRNNFLVFNFKNFFLVFLPNCFPKEIILLI